MSVCIVLVNGFLASCAAFNTKLPTPDGSMAVGVQTLVLCEGDARSQAYVWYPASSSKGLTAMTYQEGELNNALAKQYNPAWAIALAV